MPVDGHPIRWIGDVGRRSCREGLPVGGGNGRLTRLPSRRYPAPADTPLRCLIQRTGSRARGRDSWRRPQSSSCGVASRDCWAAGRSRRSSRTRRPTSPWCRHADRGSSAGSPPTLCGRSTDRVPCSSRSTGSCCPIWRSERKRLFPATGGAAAYSFNAAAGAWTSVTSGPGSAGASLRRRDLQRQADESVTGWLPITRRTRSRELELKRRPRRVAGERPARAGMGDLLGRLEEIHLGVPAQLPDLESCASTM